MGLDGRSGDLASLPWGIGVQRQPDLSISLAENSLRILPQVVPPSLLEFCQREGRELVAVPFASDLAVAFVLDEEERYCYITTAAARNWGASDQDLLAVAVKNLQGSSRGLSWKQIGTGDRAFYLCETFDGYDASRILLVEELSALSEQVAGSLVVGIPHRDFLIAFGDHNLQFVADLTETIQQDFLSARYPITPQLYTVAGRRVSPYDPCESRQGRMFH